MMEAVGSFTQINEASNPGVEQLPAGMSQCWGCSSAGTFGLHFPGLGSSGMSEGQVHVLLTTGLTGLLLLAVLALLCYFTCRLAASLPRGGPATF